MKILRDDKPADGNGTPAPEPAHKPEPPVTAKIINTGKTERELLLEKQKERLVKVARKMEQGKKTAEEQAAHAIRENQQLKQHQQQQAAKEKFSWMGFGG